MNTRNELLEILALIHRDGGHHVADVGIEQALLDAKYVLYMWREAYDSKLTKEVYMTKADYVLDMSDILVASGLTKDNSGRFNVPATQEMADTIAAAALTLLPKWEPGSPMLDLILTGAGPIWAYCVVCHSLHGHVARLSYSSPNVSGTIEIFNHGLQ